MEKIQITCISDTHNQHRKLDKFLDKSDLLIHAGDLTSRGSEEEIKKFINWYESLEGFNEKIFIAGNHDFLFQDKPTFCKKFLEDFNMKYLESSNFNYNGINIWGVPYQPIFHNWAFNLNDEELVEKWNEIPNDTDIIVVHGPPYGILDETVRGEKAGCKFLLDRIKTVKPKIVIFGHIHEAAGYLYNREDDTHYINAAILDRNYYFRNKPFKFNWSIKDNTIEIL